MNCWRKGAILLSITIAQESITKHDSSFNVLDTTIIISTSDGKFDSNKHSITSDDGVPQTPNYDEEFAKRKTNITDNLENSLFIRYQGLIGAFIGAFFGALGAALIAYFSIQKTHLNSSKLLDRQIRRDLDNRNLQADNKRINAEKLYCGLLYIIHNDLRGHEYYSEMLIN